MVQRRSTGGVPGGAWSAERLLVLLRPRASTVAAACACVRATADVAKGVNANASAARKQISSSPRKSASGLTVSMTTLSKWNAVCCVDGVFPAVQAVQRERERERVVAAGREGRHNSAFENDGLLCRL